MRHSRRTVVAALGGIVQRVHALSVITTRRSRRLAHLLLAMALHVAWVHGGGGGGGVAQRLCGRRRHVSGKALGKGELLQRCFFRAASEATLNGCSRNRSGRRGGRVVERSLRSRSCGCVQGAVGMAGDSRRGRRRGRRWYGALGYSIAPYPVRCAACHGVNEHAAMARAARRCSAWGNATHLCSAPTNQIPARFYSRGS